MYSNVVPVDTNIVSHYRWNMAKIWRYHHLIKHCQTNSYEIDRYYQYQQWLCHHTSLCWPQYCAIKDVPSCTVTFLPHTVNVPFAQDITPFQVKITRDEFMSIVPMSTNKVIVMLNGMYPVI
jgi:hypothetical protein